MKEIKRYSTILLNTNSLKTDPLLEASSDPNLILVFESLLLQASALFWSDHPMMQSWRGRGSRAQCRGKKAH
jgi:hypothetical protein